MLHHYFQSHHSSLKMGVCEYKRLSVSSTSYTRFTLPRESRIPPSWLNCWTWSGLIQYLVGGKGEGLKSARNMSERNRDNPWFHITSKNGSLPSPVIDFGWRKLQNFPTCTYLQIDWMRIVGELFACLWCVLKTARTTDLTSRHRPISAAIRHCLVGPP